MSDACLFCAILRGDIPADVVHRADGFLAFRDIAPKAPVHVLVIPERHVVSRLDHKNLNLDVGWFRDLLPSAEHIALVTWRELRPHIPAPLALRVRLWETPRNWVDYDGR